MNLTIISFTTQNFDEERKILNEKLFIKPNNIIRINETDHTKDNEINLFTSKETPEVFENILIIGINPKPIKFENPELFRRYDEVRKQEPKTDEFYYLHHRIRQKYNDYYSKLELLYQKIGKPKVIFKN
jgi:hypothetical protein